MDKVERNKTPPASHRKLNDIIHILIMCDEEASIKEKEQIE